VRSSRDGRSIERLGFFNPIAVGAEEKLRVDLERVDHWIGNGAQMTERVADLVKQARKAAAAA
jgi:small subunit ribosomal protein S16